MPPLIWGVPPLIWEVPPLIWEVPPLIWEVPLLIWEVPPLIWCKLRIKPASPNRLELGLSLANVDFEDNLLLILPSSAKP